MVIVLFFRHRFYRDHCVPVGCSFVKDLSIFTRDLSKLIIVDNQIASFAFQIDNGIPIRSWVGDDDDRELLHLANFLENIAETEVRNRTEKGIIQKNNKTRQF